MVQYGKGNIKYAQEDTLWIDPSNLEGTPHSTEQDNEGRNIRRNQRLIDKDSEY